MGLFSVLRSLITRRKCKFWVVVDLPLSVINYSLVCWGTIIHCAMTTQKYTRQIKKNNKYSKRREQFLKKMEYYFHSNPKFLFIEMCLWYIRYHTEVYAPYILFLIKIYSHQDLISILVSYKTSPRHTIRHSVQTYII